MTQLTPEKIRAILNKPEAKQLMFILQQRNGAGLERVLQAAEVGDQEKARQLLTPMLADTEAAALIKKLGNDLG